MEHDTFDNRPEDYLNKGLRAVASSLPVIGGPLVEFLAFASGDPAQERRDDFMREVVERLLLLERDFDAASKEHLRQNEAFQATFLHATRLSTITTSSEKRRQLQNAILNTVVASLDESVRVKLLSVLEEISPAHMRLLLRVAERPILIGDLVRDDNPRQFQMNHALLTDMYGMSLIRNGGQMIGEAAALDPSPNGGVTVRPTPLGEAFLKFISDPTENPSA